jgi:hypothetical protein
MPWLNVQIERLANGLDPDLSLGGREAVEEFTRIETKNMKALLAVRRAQSREQVSTGEQA